MHFSDTMISNPDVSFLSDSVACVVMKTSSGPGADILASRLPASTIFLRSPFQVLSCTLLVGLEDLGHGFGTGSLQTSLRGAASSIHGAHRGEASDM